MRPGSARRNTVDIDTELRLVEGLQAGDATALEALMERYSSRLYRLAYGITRSSRDAEEVLQDVFLTVFRKIGSFEGRATLGTWLYRVTTNAALNRRRGLAARGYRHSSPTATALAIVPSCLPTGRERRRRSCWAGKRERCSSAPWPLCPTATAPCSSYGTSMGSRARKPPTYSASRCPR